MQDYLFMSLVQDAHLGEGEGCSVTIPTPLPQWGRRQNISASPLVANVPKVMIYSTESVCVSEGKGILPLSCAAAPASWQAESRDGRNEVLAVTQSRCVTCFHFSDTVLMSSSAAASPLIEVKLCPCSSFISAVVNRCKQKETCCLLPNFHIRAK